VNEEIFQSYNKCIVLCLIILQIKSIAPLGSKKFWLMTFKITLRLEKKKHTKSKMLLVFGKMFAI